MSRLPVIAFGALVVASIAAFFVTQHLKVTTPLIAGDPFPAPASISTNGIGCGNRRMTISFYLLHRADDVDVYVVDQTGAIVATLASGRHMTIHPPVRSYFSWDAREDNGSPAPDGTYYIRVALIHQGRTVELQSKPITVKTTRPIPVVTSVSPLLIPQNGTPVTIHYTGNEHRGGTARIYRTDRPGPPRLVKSFGTPWKGQQATWDGLIQHRPAPAGVYLVGLDVTDAACNTGHFPPFMPPPPGTTPHAGLTVRYLAAEPPFDPVRAGSRALVYVDSRHRPYRWALRRAGKKRPIASGASSRVALRIKLPGTSAGLYELAIRLRSSQARTAVPLLASAPGHRRILVVLPALSWQGQNPVDDDGDGLPNTLESGGPINLLRPLANGMPVELPAEAAFLAYLDKAHLPYDLTTDLALIDGNGPTLRGRTGVVLTGSERWLPSSLGSALRSYVLNGGKVLSLGIDSLRRTVTVAGTRATRPQPPSAADVFGAKLGALVRHSTDLITVIRDDLGLFSGTSGAFAGFGSYQPIASVAPPGQIVSDAGASTTAPSIVGYRLGHGTVVEIGLPAFSTTLARNVDSQELLNRLWTVLRG